MLLPVRRLDCWLSIEFGPNPATGYNAANNLVLRFWDFLRDTEPDALDSRLLAARRGPDSSLVGVEPVFGQIGAEPGEGLTAFPAIDPDNLKFLGSPSLASTSVSWVP